MTGDDVEDIYRLSPVQQGILFHTLADPASGVYFNQLACSLRGELDAAAFEWAWRRVVDRHPPLRSDFVWAGVDEPAQVVNRRADLPIEWHDWRGLSPADQGARLESLLRRDRERGFDLARAPLMRLAVARTGEDAHEMVWSYHHLVLDGWSMALVLGEALALYGSRRRGGEEAPRPAHPYREYVDWLSRQDLAAAESFWREALKGFRAPTPLAVVRPEGEGEGAGVAGDRFGRRELTLTGAVASSLAALARENQLTLNAILQGAWALLLSRYSGERDVVFGATVSGRPPALAGVESMVGLFINTIPARVRLDPRAPLVPWLKGLQEQQAEARQYEYAPLVEVQGASEVPRGKPLFDSILVFENYPAGAFDRGTAAGLEIAGMRSIEYTNYPVTVLAGGDAGRGAGGEASLSLAVTYDRRRLDDAAASRMLGHLRAVLEGMARDPWRRLGDLPLLAPAELSRLAAWNDTGRLYAGGDRCLDELVAEQARRSPDAPAVTFEGQGLTFRELDRRAGQLARFLRARGAGPEGVVGVCMERSLEMVVALLGVLKAGAAYLPLDPRHPAERLAYMVEDARARLVVTHQRLWPPPGAPAQAPCPLSVQLDDEWTAIAAAGGDERPSASAAPDNLAYVIYTSGSTGRPKGVMVPHRGVVNRLLWMQDLDPLTPADRVLQKTPFSFDISVWEFFWPLIAGAVLVVARPGGHRDPAYLAGLIESQGVTVAHFVPAMLRAFLDRADLRRCSTLRRVVSGGEALPHDLQQRFFARLDSRLLNLYGPTETSVEVTAWECRRDGASRVVPIGRPIANAQAHILDDRLELVPVGVAGELYIGGVAPGRGYLGRPDLTAQGFIPDPWGGAAGGRLYRSGDLARWLPDGNIEYLGRADFQVKIRGVRVEPGEIEAALRRHPAVRAAVVVARADPGGGDRLVAYIVPAPGCGGLAGELRTFLGKSLPDFMVPSAYVELDGLPLTPSGKVDRRALPDPAPAAGGAGGGGRTFVAPRGATEQALAGICRLVLGVPGIGRHDNFFELGGHSLKAIQLVSRVRDAFGVDLAVAAVFDGPTVAAMAQRVDAALATEGCGAPDGPRP